MNCYNPKNGDKYYCLDPINSSYYYTPDQDYTNKIWNYYLICNEDNSKNLLHRIDGFAEKRSDGSKIWYYKGLLHRENGPACEFSSGTKKYFNMGKLHRLDGPAIEYRDGEKEWHYHGEKIQCKDNEEFLKIISMKAFL